MMRPDIIAPGTVLIVISSEEKRKIFELDIEQADGAVVSLIKALEAGSDTDEHFSQSVQLGTVLAVADDVTGISVGDLAVLDYIADADDRYIAYMDGKDKVISMQAKTSFHQDSKIVYANIKKREDSFSWQAGDVDTMSLIYGFVRDNLLVPNDHYIFLEHRDLSWEGVTPNGITYTEYEGENVWRRVLAAGPESICQPGELVLTRRELLYERSIEGKNFDVVMDRDILGKKRA